jgi:hypothetical protein
MSKILPILIRATGLGEHDILRIVGNAPVRYKTYIIPKRNGGERVISQPARELKALQRAISEEILSRLPVHSAATAYRTGVSIKANAAAHVKNGPILKYDFKDFFPSISAYDWHLYCRNHDLFDDAQDIFMSTQILFRKYGRLGLRLAIGAPSSPVLSNVLMHDFDSFITEIVSKDSVTYTRYADDLTFSARRTGFLTGVDRSLREAIRSIRSPDLMINEDKTVLATPKYKRMVTGLVLTNDSKVSIGYRRKREIRAALNNEKYGRLTLVERAKLAGLLAFVNDVEPDFLARLKVKYGEELIQRLKTTRMSSRLGMPVGR